MKNLLSLFLAILFICQNAISQQLFSFNDAVHSEEEGIVKLASEVNPLDNLTSKMLLNTGPFEVNHDLINKRLDIEMTNVFDVLDFEIQDMNGLKIKSPTKRAAGTIQVGLNHLPKGLYVLKLKGGNQTFSTKIQHGI